MKRLTNLNFRLLVDKLGKMPLYYYVPLTYISVWVVLLPVLLLANWLKLGELGASPSIPDNNWLKYLMVVVVSPFLETLICQTIPYYLLGLFTFFKNRPWIIILLSSLVFGIAHELSFQYNLSMTIFGFFLISTYFIREKRNDSFLATFLLHALFNFVGVTLTILFRS